jgi:cytochrome c oxidase assembly protein subunit 11
MGEHVSEAPGHRRANRSLTLRLWLFAGGFFVFGFALVPLYSVLCDITGYGDRTKLTQTTAIEQSPVAGRTVTVELLASVPDFGDWEFHPRSTQVQVQLGRLAEARFYTRNLRALPVTTQAVPSIAPLSATQYFHKTECFCFTPQSFAGGEARDLIVRFIVDSKLPANIDRVTLAYTLYTAESQAQPGSS